ncbi:unnamed protein product [Acanthoscelides obtectus]|uniref:F5/8 type C domain-containing protein n=1 Tax=Acanthoscelides obtectus TaxID=200917 RepID=A0A9P0LRK9_ACAOB|nr:unnamed protein product [Acanthoscelides obtectus]CAK1683206.1 Discoidin domain-containing receptor A [Acanthoscelides obtectus]
MYFETFDDITGICLRQISAVVKRTNTVFEMENPRQQQLIASTQLSRRFDCISHKVLLQKISKWPEPWATWLSRESLTSDSTSRFCGVEGKSTIIASEGGTRTTKKLLTGNTDTYSIVEQKLEPPIIASKIRFIPYSDHVRTVCMRVEILGCRWTGQYYGYASDFPTLLTLKYKPSFFIIPLQIIPDFKQASGTTYEYNKPSLSLPGSLQSWDILTGLMGRAHQENERVLPSQTTRICNFSCSKHRLRQLAGSSGI